MSLFKKKYNNPNESLLREIASTQRALEAAYSNVENVIEPDLIDSYIYEVNAIQHRYKFLLKQAKHAEQTISAV